MIIRVPEGPWTDTTRRKIEELLRQASKAQAIAGFTATTTLSGEDGTVLMDATGGARTVNLPPAAVVKGLIYTVKKIDASGNAVTIDPNGAETIDGSATKVLSAQWASLTIQSNGTAWFTI